MKEYDIIVIGAGAGVKISSPASKLGQKVALVEKGPLGGTCLNRGCIPSKMLIHPADVAVEIEEADRFSIEVDLDYKVRWRELVERVAKEIDEESASINPAVEKNPNLDWYKDEAYFVSDKVLQVGAEQITAEKIIITAGTRPHVPSIPGLANTPYLTSTEALRLKDQPKRLTVLGGGYIGCELAHFYGALGTQIQMVVRGDRLLKNEDDEIAGEFMRVFADRYDVYFDHNPVRVEFKNNLFYVYTEFQGAEVVLESEQLLVATGRVPNSDVLKLAENTSISLNNQGFVNVNEFFETSQAGVWAYGDIIGKYQFRHSANYEGERLFKNLFTAEGKQPMNYHAMPHAVFSYPQVAGVGATEEELKAANIDYVVGHRKYIQSGMGMALRSDHGFVKILADRQSRKLLGAHIVGREASTLIHELIYAMRHGATTDDVLNTIHIHPALSELVPKAVQSIVWDK